VPTWNGRRVRGPIWRLCRFTSARVPTGCQLLRELRNKLPPRRLRSERQRPRAVSTTPTSALRRYPAIAPCSSLESSAESSTPPRIAHLGAVLGYAGRTAEPGIRADFPLLRVRGTVRFPPSGRVPACAEKLSDFSQEPGVARSSVHAHRTPERGHGGFPRGHGGPAVLTEARAMFTEAPPPLTQPRAFPPNPKNRPPPSISRNPSPRRPTPRNHRAISPGVFQRDRSNGYRK
jgi:hypothetical protein